MRQQLRFYSDFEPNGFSFSGAAHSFWSRDKQTPEKYFKIDFTSEILPLPAMITRSASRRCEHARLCQEVTRSPPYSYRAYHSRN